MTHSNSRARLSAVFGSRWLLLAVELVLVVAVFLGTYRLAFPHLNTADTVTFIYWELKPAVMMSCGFGMTEPAVMSPAAETFMARKSDGVSCQDFAWGGAPTPAIGIAFANRYSIYGAAWAMRWQGVSWRTLDGYLAFLFGVAMACVYGLYRMATGRVLALCGVAVVACSPILNEIVSLRDFVKFPCFAALWLALAWVLRRGLSRGPAATVLPMAVSGALLGVGIGLRMDALILVPLFVLVAYLVAPGFSWRQLGVKTLATVLFAALFWLTGGPILRSMSSGSNSAHVIVLGLMAPFDPGLSVEAGPYDIGTQYSDGYAYTVIAADGLARQGEQMPILLGSAKYDQIGNRLLGTLARQFPADVLARGLGATFQIFRLPFDWRIRDLAAKMPTLQSPATVKAIVEWRNWALGFFEGREWQVAAFVLVLASAINWRLGALGFLLILYLCAYSMMQFSRRHTFHLDVMPILTCILALQLPATLAWRIAMQYRAGRDEAARLVRGYRREMVIGTGALAGVLVLFSGTVLGAQAWQQRSVTGLIDATLAAPWLPVTATEEPLADTILQNGNPVPSWYEIYVKNPERWKTATLLRLDGVVPRGAEAEAPPELRQQYFKVVIEDHCGTPNIAVGIKYSGAGTSYDYEYTRAFTIPTNAAAPSVLLVPAYYHLGSSWNRFDGFAVPAGQRACITAIYRAEQPARLPLPALSFALGPDWRSQPLRQRLLSRPKVTAAGTPVDPLPTDKSVHGSGWRRTGDEALALIAPPLDKWEVSEGVAVTKTGSGFTVIGNRLPSGYQLMSPPLDVPAGQVLSVQIVGTLDRGEMCVGVLDGAQQKWLLAPASARIGLLADTGAYTQVRIVFSNCANPPGEFTVKSISYQAFLPEP